MMVYTATAAAQKAEMLRKEFGMHEGWRPDASLTIGHRHVAPTLSHGDVTLTWVHGDWSGLGQAEWMCSFTDMHGHSQRGPTPQAALDATRRYVAQQAQDKTAQLEMLCGVELERG